MIIHLATDPLPYSALSIVDTSPFHSSLDTRSASKPRARRWAPRAAAVGIVAGLAVLAGSASVVSGTADAGDGPFGFRMGPGHAMPPSLIASADAPDFRLAPGNAMPLALAPSTATGFRMAPGLALPPTLER